MERARQRQKKLIESHSDESSTPLKEYNLKNQSDTAISPFDDDTPNTRQGYENNKNKPKINNVTLKGTVSKGDYIIKICIIYYLKNNTYIIITFSYIEDVNNAGRQHKSDHNGEKENQHRYLEESCGIRNGECISREDTKKRLQRLGKFYAGIYLCPVYLITIVLTNKCLKTFVIK